MVDAAVGIALKELCDRRGLAERLDELDLGVGECCEHCGDAMLGQRDCLRDLGPERRGVDFRSLDGILGRDRDMVKPAQHVSLPRSTIRKTAKRLSGSCLNYTVSTCTRQGGFLPQCSLITDRTVRRTDSASASGARRRAFGSPSIVATTAA